MGYHGHILICFASSLVLVMMMVHYSLAFLVSCFFSSSSFFGLHCSFNAMHTGYVRTVRLMPAVSALPFIMMALHDKFFFVPIKNYLNSRIMCFYIIWIHISFTIFFAFWQFELVFSHTCVHLLHSNDLFSQHISTNDFTRDLLVCSPHSI